MAAPLIPIVVAVGRAAAPHVARQVGKKAATKAAQKGATQTATRAGTTAGSRSTMSRVTSSVARNVDPNTIGDLAERGMNSASNKGLTWLEQRGAGPETTGQQAANPAAAQQHRRDVHPEVAQGEESTVSPKSSHNMSAFSVQGAISALNETGNRAASVSSQMASPFQATHKALVG